MENMTFEQALKALEEVVSKLEEGQLSLEESVKMYQKGIELAKRCSEELKAAEKIVVKLMNQGKEEDFETNKEE